MKRLKSLRIKNNLTQKEMADFLKTSASPYTLYELEKILISAIYTRLLKNLIVQLINY